MPPKSILFRGRVPFFCVLFLAIQFITAVADAQMRQVYLDDSPEHNPIKSISFYSPSAGYVAFHDWIGYTTDSGRSFTRKYLTNGNIDFTGSPLIGLLGYVNNGMQALDQQTILMYGQRVGDAIIFRSTDGGNTFRVAYFRPIDANNIGSGIEAMSFPQNGTVGYAIDRKHVTKTVNSGQSWSVVYNQTSGGDLDHVQAIDANNVFIFSATSIGGDGTNNMYKTTNGGASWQPVTLPTGSLYSAYFLTATTGWLSTKEGFYQTVNGGASWTKQNDPAVLFFSPKFIFTDNQTGYSLGTSYTVYKTTDAGKIWEPLPRDNNFSYDQFGLDDLFCYNSNQLWAGGGHGFLELSTNGGGTPLPKAFFSKDTTGLYTTGTVNLTNHSKTSYSFKWFKNDTLITNTYHASYIRSAYPLRDTIMLVASNGINTDTAIQYQDYNEPAYISSFTPPAAKPATIVTINGAHFTGATAVSFGGTPASSFTVVDDNTITAVVGTGSSGNIAVVTPFRGIASLPGFTYLPPPAITSFAPVAATAGTVITITGSNFLAVESVTIGGIQATYTVVSSTIITVIAPSGKAGVVEVRTKGGIAQLSGYTAIPAIATFSPAIGTQGTILKIKGTSLLDVTGVTIGGMPAVSFTVITADSMTAQVGLGATGSVVVSAPGNTASRAGFTYADPPAITSFTPSSGPIGTSVTIIGTNFRPVTGENIVMFGSLRATVTAASSTSLIVTVPAGATAHNITVTTNGLTAFSSRTFQTTFAGGGAITPASFVKTNITTEGPGVWREYYEKAVADIDDDGKEDLLITDGWFGDAKTDVLVNTSTGNTLSFDPFLKAAPLTSSFTLADLDGDGKSEFISAGSAIEIHRNTSTPGAPSLFDNERITFSAGVEARSYHTVAVNDIDKDGKTDVVFACQDVMFVYRNIGDPGRLAFELISLPYGGYDLALADIDLDGRPDIIQYNPATGSITVYKNTSTKGQVGFTPAITLPANTPYTLTTGDVDGDGLPDILAGSQSGSKIEVFRNTSTGNTIAFANAKEYAMPGITYDLTLADLNGDGKPEIAASTDKFHFVTFTNISTTGNIEFEPSVNHFPGTYSFRDFRFRISIGDLNSDGRPDPVIIDKPERARLSIYTNQTIAKPYIREFTPANASKDEVVTIKGRNFTGVTAVNFGGVAAAFTVVNDTTIRATVGTGATGNLAITNQFGTAEMDGFVFGAIPKITSFSPAAGPVGAQVVLTGSGFDPVPTNNIVFFGGVKTNVVSATSTSLTITVPAGAAPDWISVTTNSRTAYAGKHFVVTFPGNQAGFSDTSFVNIQVSMPGALTSLADLDRDGKNDLMSVHYQQGVFVNRNTSTIGTVSLGAPIDLGMVERAITTAAGDLDGDGLIDVVALSATTNTFQAFRNTTTAAITFAAGITFKAVDDLRPGTDIAIGDVDGDGRPDVIFSTSNALRFTVLKNLSTPGKISFADPLEYAYNGFPYGVTCEDVDNDGRAEVMLRASGFYNTGEGVVVFKNTGAPGTIDMTLTPGVGMAGSAITMAYGDLDGDGRTDISLGSTGPATISIGRNVTATENYSFSTKIYMWMQDVSSTKVGVGDLDGDGRPEVVVGSFSWANLGNFIYKNISTPGNITLKEKVKIKPGIDGTKFVDMDGDGALDMISGGGSVELNKMAKDTVVVELCQQADTTLLAGLTAFTYQWQQDNGNGFVNIQDNSNFSGATSDKLRLIDVPASWNNYKYRCLDNNLQTVRVYKLNISNTGVLPSVVIATLHDTLCAGSNITFEATPVNGGGTPTYQWQVNGIAAGQNASTFGTNTLNDGDEVKVVMTSNAACASTPTVVSNIIPVTVRSILDASVTIKASPDIGCSDGKISFIATPVNAGLTPMFQWVVNTSGAGENKSTFSSDEHSLRNGDTVKVLLDLNSSNGCSSVYKVFSNVITIGGSAPGDPKMPVTPSVSITASSTNVCTGGTVTFTATPKDGGITPVYQWQVNGINVGQNSPTFTSSTLTGGDAIKVIMTGNAPCTVEPSVTSNVITLTGGAPVTPSVSITASEALFCAGTAVTYTATPVNGGNTPAYQWQVNGVNVGQNINTFTTTALNDGDKVTVSLITSAACATTPSVISNTITAAVTPNITPVVTVTASATSICPGTKVSFTATTPTSITNPSYFWFVNDMGASANGNTFSSSTLADGDKVYATMFTTQSCVTDMLTKSNIVPVSVGTSLTASVSVAASATSICAGSNVTFTATPVNGGSAPTYQWQVNGVNAGQNANTFTSNSLTSADVVKVIMTSNAGCVSSATATSNSISVTVTTGVTPSVSITASATTICAGSNVTFTATPVNGGSVPNYQWQVNGVNAGQNSNTFTSNSLANADVVKVIMTSNAGCVSSATAASNSIPVTVTTGITPSVSITASATTICAGSNVTFTATSVNGGSAPTYQWQVNGVNAGQNSSTFTTSSLTNGSIVRVILTPNASCAPGASVTSNAITVTVYASVTPLVVLSGNTTVDQGSSTMIIAATPNGGSTPAYQWQDSTATHGWQNIPGATGYSLIYTPAETGDMLKVRYSGNFPCTGTLTVFSTPVSFVVNGLTGGRIAPNPVQSMLHIDQLQLSDNWETVEIASVSSGNKFIVRSVLNQTSVNIPVGQLSKGMYVAVLRSKSGANRQIKFMKQ
ncbi:hypothetical protein D3H65_09565 [Paraflavitalea soli]|uniref:IPT/TIG domain-containing protein n=1 Tax=Paraflavitalea soli TaxID=2315862 RepID=A0A3B7MRG5_9BACT|nr:FG-GAP-like repeat-containing protein [Paraflavitalea soli]AXY74205.1 hypothetical protein D3H65_09565 [Paraflavitalea soli]